MSVSLRNTIASLSLLMAVVVYRFAILETSLGLSNSTAQFVLLPIILMAAALFSFWQYVIPRYAIILACIASVCAGAATFSFKAERSDAVKIYLSPFLSDPHEAQSIKFSTLLNKTFDALDLDFELERISNPLADANAVSDFLKKRLLEEQDEAALVISGSSRWLSFSISPKFTNYLLSPALLKITSALKLNLVNEVSGTGLSNAFSPATQQYLARMIAAMTAFNDGQMDLAEENLVNAASIVERWTSTNHRAYALWMLGTLYLNKAFAQNVIEPAYLNCASDYFIRSRSFLKRDLNPELTAAVLNNMASTHFLSYIFLGRKDLRKRALKEFKVASKFTFKPNNFTQRPAWLVAKENLYYLKRATNLKKQFARKLRKMKKGKSKN